MVTTDPPVTVPETKPEPVEAKTEPAVGEPRGSNPIAWTVALIAVVAFVGGGLVLLRRGN